MKSLRTGILILCLSLILTALSLFFSGRVTLPWSPFRETSVYTTLIESGETALLHAAEYRLKVLFPYDFIEKGVKPDWWILQSYYNRDPDEFALKSSESFYPDSVLPEPWNYARLYALCRESGVDPAADPDFFVVLTASVKAGIPFLSEQMKVRKLSGQDENDEKIILTLPVPRITDIIVEDRSDENSGFPEVDMTPAQWSRFITVLSPEISDLAVKEGILDLARESASFLVTDLFEGAGIELQEIEFSD